MCGERNDRCGNRAETDKDSDCPGGEGVAADGGAAWRAVELSWQVGELAGERAGLGGLKKYPPDKHMCNQLGWPNE